MVMSAAMASAPTISGAMTSAAPKPRAGCPPRLVATHHASTAPSMKNSPCAILTTRITPKTRLSPTAVSASTAAVTAPSSVASTRQGPRSIRLPGCQGSLRYVLHPAHEEALIVGQGHDLAVLAFQFAGHDLVARLPVIGRVLAYARPGQPPALAPRVKHDARVIGIAPRADDRGAVLKPKGVVGIGHRAMQVERLEVFGLEPILHVACPVPAEPARFQPHIDLGIVHDGRIGDLVFQRQIMRVPIGHLCGAVGLLGIDLRPEAFDRSGKAADLLGLRWGRCRAGGQQEHRPCQHASQDRGQTHIRTPASCSRPYRDRPNPRSRWYARGSKCRSEPG